MWWARSDVLEVYLAPSLLGDGAGWHELADLEAGLRLLRRRLEERAGRLRLRVRLGSALARPWTLPADSGARDAREAAALAAVTAQDMVGDDAKVWCAPWRAGRPTLVAAVPRGLWDALQALADGRRVRLDSVRPWWNEVLDDALARSRAQASVIGFSLREPDGLLSGRVERGQVVEAAFEAPKGHDPQWRQLRRRLEANWHDLERLEHLDFAREGATGAALPAQGGAA